MESGARGMNILAQLNSLPLYLICGGIILVVCLVSVVFMIRAWRAAVALGMDRSVLRRTVTGSITFTLLPSVSILLGVIALSGSLGTPLPWLRLSVIGALHYETTVADIAARGVGLSGLRISEMTAEAFVTIALLMAVGICWGMLLTALLNKKYTGVLSAAGKKKGGKTGPGFGDKALAAMFVGMVCAYIGTYIGTFTSTGEYVQLVVIVVAALAMAVFLWLVEKKNLRWLESFSIAGSMLIAMAAAVAVGALV